MCYFYVTEFQHIADYRAFQWKLLVKKQQVEIQWTCKWKSFLFCFVYVKYKTTLIKNIISYFVKSLIQLIYNTKNHSQTIYKNLSENTVIRKVLLKFKNIKILFLN